MRRVLIAFAILALLGAGTFAQPANAVGVVAMWPVGHQPSSVAIDPADGRAYVSNSGFVGPNKTGTVSVVDPATGVVTTLTTTGVSDTVAIDASDRRLYAANAEGPGLDVFDLDSGNLITTLAAGGIGVAVDSTTHRVYTTRFGSLSVVDGLTNTVVGGRGVPDPEFWVDVVPDPGLHRLYVTNIDQSRPTLVVLDDRDLSMLTEIVMPQAIRWALAVDPSSHNVYVGGSDPSGLLPSQSSFFVVDPTSLSVVHTVVVGGFPGGIAVTPGHRIFMTDLAGHRVLELDHTTFVVTQTIALPWGPFIPAIDSDGRLLVPAYQGTGSDVLAAIDVGVAFPVVDSVTLDPAIPTTNDLLSATVVAHDSQGRPLDSSALTFDWFRNGDFLGPASPGGSRLDLSTVGDRGDTITVRVTAHEGVQSSAPKSASVIVADSAPATTLSLSSTAPTTNEILTAFASAPDADRDVVSMTLTWKVKGVVRKTSTFPGWPISDSLDLGLAGNGDRGDDVVVELVASDGTLQSVASVTVIVADSAPTATVSLNTAAPLNKSVLVATAVGADADGDGLTFAYTWRLNGTVKRTVTTLSTTDRYDLSVRGNGAKGDVVTVSVVATDASLASPSASATATVRNH